MSGKEEDHQDDAPGRAAVREHLIERLDQAGMQRPRAMKAEAFEAMRRRLVEALAYLPAEELKTLAETVMRLAGGRAKNEWPPEVSIRNLGYQLVPPPPGRIVTSWLASVEGPKALDGGWLVELYRRLLKVPLPVNDYVAGQLRAEAEDNRRLRASLRAEAEAGTISARDRQWLEDYARDEARAQRLVAEGQARRDRPASGAPAFHTTRVA